MDPLKADIVELTQKHWSSSGKALLLASLGQILTKRGYDLRAVLRGQKLVPFLQVELADKVKVLTSPYDPLVRGIVPVGEDAGKTVDTLFSQPGDAASSRINFDRRVWVAFSRAVTPNHLRVLDLEPEISFQDLPLDAAKQSGKLSIPENLIIPHGTKPSDIRNAELQKNIRKWFEANGLDIELARAKGFDFTARTGGDSLLSSLISALEKRDLERVVLPLDVVAKLLGHKTKRD